MRGNIVLCGFMGCGKTTVGKKTAKLLNLPFCDLDEYIEAREGMKIPEIFAAFGEDGFRTREAEAVEEVAQKGGMVVACGGGTVLFPKNVEAFRKSGSLIVLLYVPLLLLQERLKGDTQRPLLQRPDRHKVISELYRERMPKYRAAADCTLRAAAPVSVVAKRLAALYERRLGQQEKI